MTEKSKSQQLEELLNNGRSLTEAEAILRIRKNEKSANYGKTNDVPGSDPDEFIKKAKQIVLQNYVTIETVTALDPVPLDISEIYVVWFAKTLGNWKALLATTRPDGQYYEVIYDGAKNQSYLDTYVKVDNKCITDEELAG